MLSPAEVLAITEMTSEQQAKFLKTITDADIVRLKNRIVTEKEWLESNTYRQPVQSYIDLYVRATYEQSLRSRKSVELTWAQVHGEEPWTEPVRTGLPAEPTDWLKLISEAKEASDEALIGRSGI